jgi:hypothetical protein
MKRAGSPRLKVIAVIAVFFSILSFQPASAATLFDTMSSTGTSYGFTTGVIGIEPITIPASATIQSIVMKIASGTGSGARIDIYADNNGSPSAVSLGALTFSSYTNPNATYTGSVSLPSAGKYWFKFSTTLGFQNYYSMTPVTTGSLSGWSIGRLLESVNSGSSYSTRNDNLVYLMTINGTGGVVAQPSSISLSGGSVAIYRQAYTISASLGVTGSDGKVTFYVNGKKIPGCINKLTVSLSMTCSWKPSKRGNNQVTARVVPSDSAYLASTSQVKNVLVSSRSTVR